MRRAHAWTLILVGCARWPDGLTVTIDPAAPTTRDELTVTVTPDEPPADAISFAFAWEVDGVDVPTQSGKVLPYDVTAKGERWTVTVTPVRGRSTGATRTASVTIVNSAPTVDRVTLPTPLAADTPILASVEASDADDDPITLTFAWTADGAPISGQTGAELPAGLVRVGQTVQVTVVPSDGEVDGGAVASAPQVVATGGVPTDGGFGFTTLVDFGPGFRPTDLAELPDGRLLVSGLDCGVALFDPFADEVVAQVDLDDLPTDCVSIALHPSFGDGAHDTVTLWRNTTTELWQYTVQLEPSFDLIDGAAMFRALPGAEQSEGHSGGDLLWWAGETEDPALYLTIGDGNPDSGQDPTTPFGSMIAFAEDPSTGALVPAVPASAYANPLNVAKGLRNAWRLADCGPTICIADVAREDWEELDIYERTPVNYGWSVVEGAAGDPAYTDPAWMYHHDDAWPIVEDTDNAGIPDEMNVVWVGDRLSESVFDARLAGGLLVGDHYDGWIRVLDLDDTGHPIGTSRHVAHLRYVTSMIEASDGRVYAADLSGTLRRLVVREEVPAADVAGAPLSLTPYYDPTVPSWPFEIRHPLWSNGSGKDRLLQLPVGARIDNTDPDQWVFPVGTRLWKTFFVDDVAIETRVLERREDAWVTGTYQYDDTGEAWFTDGYNTTVSTASGDYLIPSITSCEECHAGSRGKDFPLGLSAFQLGDAGLASLQDALLLPQADAPEIVGDDLSVDNRGYLHGNCSYCHNPQGRVVDLVSIELDFRYDTPLEEMHAVGVDAQFLMQPGAPILIDPGNPDGSTIVALLENAIMPPVGLWAPDTEQIADLRAWISGL